MVEFICMCIWKKERMKLMMSDMIIIMSSYCVGLANVNMNANVNVVPHVKTLCMSVVV